MKQQQQPQPPPPPTEQEEHYEDGNNYYHNENYRGNNRGHRPYRGQYNNRDHTGGLSTGEGDNKITIEANFKATAGNLILFMVAIIIITTVIIVAEQASGPPFIRKSATCRIMQDGKDPIITTDFYLTNMEPREWILPAPLTNYKGAATNSAAVACNLPPEIPGKI